MVVERPPRVELGDIAFPMFPFAKLLRKGPPQIAAAVADKLESAQLPEGAAWVKAEGPYLNAGYDRAGYGRAVLSRIESRAAEYGRTGEMAGQRITVEFSCPNTNKPLHLGHLRNDALGESISRILAANGAQVRKVNLINDRGIHICQSMLAYKMFAEGRTPEEESKKSDHFVGDYYVKFHETAKQHPELAGEARELLKRWENGDPETMKLWRQMNDWAIGGIEETYRATGVSFDQIYYESETYKRGRDEIRRGLEAGIFQKEEDGAVTVDLSEIDLEKKVLLRGDGTSLYVTQDIGTALIRYDDWAFDRLVYVVASEQKYHFIVLFHVLEKLGYTWAASLYHLAYGMVNLPEGRMKSREGTIVDADDLLAQLTAMAEEEIRAKEREDAVGDLRETASKVALGALHYYLLQTTPSRDMIFNPRESLSFNGNTGPYLQYMGARICSMLRKDEGRNDVPVEQIDLAALEVSDEWEMLRMLGDYPDAVSLAGSGYNPSVIAGYLYDLAKLFSRYYHDNPIVTCEDERLRRARVGLARAVLQVFRNAFDLIGVPFLEVM
ncbi:arginine--tRNA ligase [Salinispira pacifica]